MFVLFWAFSQTSTLTFLSPGLVAHLGKLYCAFCVLIGTCGTICVSDNRRKSSYVYMFLLHRHETKIKY